MSGPEGDAINRESGSLTVKGRRTSRRALGLGCAVIAVVALVFGVRQLRVGAAIGAGGAACVGDINRLTNPSGFTSSDFTSSTAVVVSSSGAQAVSLNTNLVPLDPQKIVLPFDQDVTIKYVYRNAAASQMLDWFYFDQLKQGTKPFVITVAGKDQLADWDNDGIPDWFQTAKLPNRPLDGLWHISGSNTVPDLANSSLSYKDQTSYYYPRVPHVLELFSGVSTSSLASDHARDFIFKNCDDDGDTDSYPGSGVWYTPLPDVSTTVDGIPDYDVNSDGTVGNEPDRTVDLGTVQGNREIVFYVVNYRGNNLHRAGLGLTGAGADIDAEVIPWFTKNILNPDFNGQPAGTVLQKQAIGCARDDSACYLPLGATLGWLDPATITRLNTPTYHNLVLDSTVNTIKVDANGYAPHFVVNAPSTDPNRWIMALDNQPEYAGASDADYNDVVFLIERTNGGEVVSQNQVKSSDIPAGLTANDVLVSKVRLRFTASYPAGCSSVPNANIQFYWSVDNTTWHPIAFPIGATSGDVAIDVLGAGVVGHQLYWKADFISSSQYCQPILQTANVGYEAIPHGEYKFAAPVPLGNVVLNGTVETPSSSWTVSRNDYSVRGHFYSTPLFDPTSFADLVPSTPTWDAGAVLAAQQSSTRLGLFTNNNGAYTAFTAANGTAAFTLNGAATTLYKALLTANDRTVKVNKTPLFDFNGDGNADDSDASYIMEWTRGSEYPQNKPSGVTNAERAWKLGAVHNSSPAVIGTPGHPPWLDGSNTALATYKTAYTGSTWQADLNGIMKRRTLAIVGAQDGMLHAFDAGNFHNPTELACAASNTRLVRGCFAPTGSATTPDYGTGKEIFAYVPPTLLGALKNNLGPIHSNPSYPQAEVDGSVAVDDIYYTPTNTVSGRPANQFVTAAFAGLGHQWGAITAIGWTTMTFSGTTPVSTLPFPLWKQDWTDPDFKGGPTSPAVGVATTPSATDWVVVTTSGLNAPATDGTQKEYMFVIDASDGTTVTNGKVALDVTSPTAYGFAGFPNLVDSDQDGVFDRAYAVDTAGRIYRVDLKTLAACKVANVGEAVFSGMATNVVGTSKVRLYVGGGNNPDGTGLPAAPGPYHVFAFEDDDAAGTNACHTATLVYKAATPSSGTEKVWAAPFIGDTTVYVASSGSTEAGLCAAGAGSFFGLSTDGDGQSTPAPISSTPVINLGISAVSSIRIFDGHAFINGVSQETAVVGKTGWNNKPTGSGTQSNPTLTTLRWSEQ